MASRTQRSFAAEVERRLQRLSGIATTPIGPAMGRPGSDRLVACVVPGEAASDRPWVLISAGVHGDEIAGIFAALEFLETRAHTLARWFRFAVLPCVNPSGFARGTLETATGANLNRLFGTRSAEPEVVAVESWLDASQRRFLATFDLHEIDPDYRGEGFVASDNPRACYLYETQADSALRLGRTLIDALPPSMEVCRWPIIYNDRNDAGVVSYPEACQNPIYAEQTTLDAYLSARYTSHAFTLETPMGWPLETRVQAHLIWLEAALCRLGKRL